jgi:hypothetical protein
MKYISGFVLFSLLVLQLHSQVITGKIYDASSGAPLEYVSIGIIETSVGTITDEKGNFNIEVKGLSTNARVRFSMIGFKSQTFTIEQLSLKENIIKLENEAVQLKEVIIKPSGKFRKVGATNYTWHGGWCGWGGIDFGKGYEIGIKINLGILPVRLKSLHIHIDKQSFDSSLFRIHIRNIMDNLPLDELLNKNILISITKESGWIDIDLSKYNLVFKGDIALSLEWIKIIGVNKDKLMKMNGSKQYSAIVLFNIKRKLGCTYTRWGSEAKWTRTDNESPSFYLTIEE